MTVVFNVDTNCYVMKTSVKFQSDKRGGISNCKKCNGKKEDDLEGYDDDHSDVAEITSPSMKEIYRQTHVGIQGLLRQKNTENLSSNIFNSPVALPQNIRLFA